MYKSKFWLWCAERLGVRCGLAALSFEIEAKGFACLLASRVPPDSNLQALMAGMKEITSRPLATYSHEWTAVQQKIIPIAPTRIPTQASEDPLPGSCRSLAQSQVISKVQVVYFALMLYNRHR